jgi:D-alanyl-D-alanine carboxypeptidase (penicillin-binding protein 5/6)
MTTTHRRITIAIVVAAAVLITATAAHAVLAERDDAGRNYLGAGDWPIHGEAAYALDAATVVASPKQPTVPIASLAKVMTAYLVLRAYPLFAGTDGFTIGITSQDVADTATRRSQDQSVVAVRAGEQLTERQALAALLLPSANNIAIVLAKIVAGSVPAFVALMNDMAHSLRMWHTAYTDPSGFDAGTRSTAADQLLLARTASAVPAFADLVSRSSVTIPVAGTVHNTDSLLGKDGFAGIKTGSMDASGGCFMFVTHRVIGARSVDLYGVVLGQPGHNLITAALTAARQLADKVARPQV